MKKPILMLAAGLLAGLNLQAQTPVNPDQNPRHREAYEAYRVDTAGQHAGTLGATMDQTYVAHDPIEIKAQERRERKEQRRIDRQERRMARIENRNRGWFYPRPRHHRGW